jgi:hypothetical protein
MSIFRIYILVHLLHEVVTYYTNNSILKYQYEYDPSMKMISNKNLSLGILLPLSNPRTPPVHVRGILLFW